MYSGILSIAKGKKLLLFGCAAVLIGFFIGFFRLFPSVSQLPPGINAGGKPGPGYLPSGVAETGDELVLVFVGASHCAFSNLPDLSERIKTAKEILQRQAESVDQRFVAVGIAVDMDPGAGLEHLEGFGAFDEVNSGRGWYGMGATKYLWEDFPGEDGTPQLLIMNRRLEVFSGEGEDALKPRYALEEVVLRLVGAKDIIDWVDRGMPFPVAGTR
jgi:hypothetical protein